MGGGLAAVVVLQLLVVVVVIINAFVTVVVVVEHRVICVVVVQRSVARVIVVLAVHRGSNKGNCVLLGTSPSRHYIPRPLTSSLSIIVLMIALGKVSRNSFAR